LIRSEIKGSFYWEVNNLEDLYYKTYHNGKVIEYKKSYSKYGSSPIGITVNGEVWGSPQGDRFFLALINDIYVLKEENSKLKRMVEEGIGFEDLHNPDDLITPQSR